MALKPHSFLVICAVFILAGNGNARETHPNKEIWHQNAIHNFIIDSAYSRVEVNKILQTLIYELDINEFGSSFIILDGNNPYIIMVPESYKQRGWYRKFHPNKEKPFNFLAIADYILKSKGISEPSEIQRPIHYYIITKESQFPDVVIDELKSFDKNGKTFILTPNAHDPARNIFNSSNSEFINYIKKDTEIYPTVVYPQRMNGPFDFTINIERDGIYHLKIDYDEPSQSGNDQLVVSGTESAPISICKDIQMKNCYPSLADNTFVVLFEEATHLFVKVNGSYDFNYSDTENHRQQDISTIRFEFSQKSDSIQLYANPFLICIFAFLLI